MNGIYGWVNFPQDTEEVPRTLNAMAGGPRGNALPSDRFSATHTCAVAWEPGIVPLATHRTGALAVAIHGSPQWRSKDLASSAAERGSAATLADAYVRNGSDCLQEIWGACSLAVVDLESGNALLAVDRLGIRTMCYANPPGQLVFGSTADSVASHPSVGRRLSHQAIFNYLYCHMVPSPGTIYEGIQKLQPGECLIFRHGALERRFYWHLHYNDHDNASLPELEKRFRELLREAVRRTVGRDTDIGAFLSGGTDSSTVAGLLAEMGRGPARTYSIGFSADGFDEMEYARITSRHFSTEAHEYYVTPQDVVDAIPVIAAAYDEPFGNASAVPTYLCARMAHADGVRVMLAGDGGDEIFGGNVRYAKQKVFEAYWAIPAGLRRTLIEPLAMNARGATFIPPLRKLQSYVRQASVPLPDRLESYNFLHRAAAEGHFGTGISCRNRPGPTIVVVARRIRTDGFGLGGQPHDAPRSQIHSCGQRLAQGVANVRCGGSRGALSAPRRGPGRILR